MRDRELKVSEMVFKIKHATKFYCHFEDGRKDCFVYEYCEGGDLTGLRRKQPNERFTEATVKKYIMQLSHAINEMHKLRIVHRDIKPDNTFLVLKDGQLEVSCGDFGTAREVNESNEFKLEVNETINTTTVGSGFYASPEMKAERPNGTPTDVWSFGVLIGVVLGLDDVCPTGYKGGLPGFIKDCVADKHDLWLHQ